MPEVILRDLIVNRLKETQYNPNKLLKTKSGSYLLKNYLAGLDENIVIIDDNVFEITINTDEYNEIVYTETYYEINRINRQLDAVNSLINSPSSPKAWLIVSAYYYSFFCANLISRLLGRYSCYFSSEEMLGLKTYADNQSNKSLLHGNYVGSFMSSDVEGVKIRFRGDGERPHYTAWKNLHDKFELSSRGSGNDVERYNRIRLFKNIINESNSIWPLPSEIRNRWNYGDTFLYTKKGDDIAREFSSFFGSSADIRWSGRKNLRPDDQNIATSIVFISSTLGRCLDACKTKILR